MWKIKLIKALTFLSGLFFVLDFFLPKNWTDALHFPQVNEPLSQGFLVVSAMAFGLGFINLIRIHGNNIFRRFKKYGIYSSVLLVSFFATLAFGALDWRTRATNNNELDQIKLTKTFITDITKDSPLLRQRVHVLANWLNNEFPQTFVEEALALQTNYLAITKLEPKLQEKLDKIYTDKVSLQEVTTEQSLAYRAYYFIENGIFSPLGSAMFSLLAFYIASASFRAFKIRSKESALMVASAVIVIFGQTFIGDMISSSFADMRLWLLEVPNSAAFRAIKLSSAIAMVVLAVKMLLSLES